MFKKIKFKISKSSLPKRECIKKKELDKIEEQKWFKAKKV
jgi:hypothetical protein